MVKRHDAAPWEREHMLEEQRLEEWKRKISTRKFLTRGQWFHGFNRLVTVQEAEARKVITTMNGRTLHLFSEDQTVER